MPNGDERNGNGYGNGNGNGNGQQESPQIEHKRLVLAAIITVLWVIMGILGVLFQVHFYDLSVYFISLTGFVGAYMISETKRPAISNSIFKKGRSSKREWTIYVVTALWLALGVVCIVMALDLLEAAAYFGALTPYISTYFIGSAYKPDLPKSIRERMLESGMYGGGYGGSYWGSYGGDPQNGHNGMPGQFPQPTGQQGQVEQVVSKPPHPEDP
jgi:hypothetical protein